MNTAGRFHSPARLSASWNVPWLAAPSPKNATATESWPSFLYASAAPVAGGMLAPSIPLHEKFVLRVEQVHVTALAAAEAGRLAEHLGGELVERDALGDREVMRPVGADDGVVVAQVGAHPDRDRLLSGGQVHLARHRPAGDVERESVLDVRRQLALEIDVHHPLLEVADDEHRLVHPEELIFVRVHGAILLPGW